MLKESNQDSDNVILIYTGELFEAGFIGKE
jgi:hypothetical protein